MSSQKNTNQRCREVKIRLRKSEDVSMSLLERIKTAEEDHDNSNFF